MSVDNAKWDAFVSNFLLGLINSQLLLVANGRLVALDAGKRGSANNGTMLSGYERVKSCLYEKS